MLVQEEKERECEREEWKWRRWRSEGGHDSPVFQAVSSLELSPHLKCNPSSVRGCLTHTGHIKAHFLFPVHTQMNRPVNTHYSKLHPGDLEHSSDCQTFYKTINKWRSTPVQLVPVIITLSYEPGLELSDFLSKQWHKYNKSLCWANIKLIRLSNSIPSETFVVLMVSQNTPLFRLNLNKCSHLYMDHACLRML